MGDSAWHHPPATLPPLAHPSQPKGMNNKRNDNHEHNNHDSGLQNIRKLASRSAGDDLIVRGENHNDCVDHTNYGRTTVMAENKNNNNNNNNNNTGVITETCFSRHVSESSFATANPYFVADDANYNLSNKNGGGFAVNMANDVAERVTGLSTGLFTNKTTAAIAAEETTETTMATVPFEKQIEDADSLDSHPQSSSSRNPSSSSVLRRRHHHHSNTHQRRRSVSFTNAKTASIVTAVASASGAFPGSLNKSTSSAPAQLLGRVIQVPTSNSSSSSSKAKRRGGKVRSHSFDDNIAADKSSFSRLVGSVITVRRQEIRRRKSDGDKEEYDDGAEATTISWKKKKNNKDDVGAFGDEDVRTLKKLLGVDDDDNKAKRKNCALASSGAADPSAADTPTEDSHHAYHHQHRGCDYGNNEEQTVIASLKGSMTSKDIRILKNLVNRLSEEDLKKAANRHAAAMDEDAYADDDDHNHHGDDESKVPTTTPEGDDDVAAAPQTLSATTTITITKAEQQGRGLPEKLMKDEQCKKSDVIVDDDVNHHDNSCINETGDSDYYHRRSSASNNTFAMSEVTTDEISVLEDCHGPLNLSGHPLPPLPPPLSKDHCNDDLLNLSEHCVPHEPLDLLDVSGHCVTQHGLEHEDRLGNEEEERSERSASNGTIGSRSEKNNGRCLSHHRSRRASSQSLPPPTSSFDSNRNKKEHDGDVLSEGMTNLATCMLVCIYAKLREMCALGHASVKLVDVDVNSHQSQARERERNRVAAMLSLREKRKGKESQPQPPQYTTTKYLKNTRTSGFIVRAVLEEYSLCESSGSYLATKRTAGSRAHHDYDASLLSDFKKWVEESKIKVLDDATVTVIQQLREHCAQQRNYRDDSTVASSGASKTIEDVGMAVQRRRHSMIQKHGSFQGASWFKREAKLIEDHFGLNEKMEQQQLGSGSEGAGAAATAVVDGSDGICPARRVSRQLSEGILTKSLIARTLEDATTYFEEGSVMKNIMESGLEMTWISDKHPGALTYGICVTRATKTVTVVLLGCESLLELLVGSSVVQHINPIAHEDYEGHAEHIKLRSGVSRELTRVRRDTGLSVVDEIREKICIIGRELVGKEGQFHLSISGHCLGGSLATVLAFFLASEDSLALASAIRVFTFASSRVGCGSFLNAYRHLEKTGRLRHARFVSTNDVLSFLPLLSWRNDSTSNSECRYSHVGMRIQLGGQGASGMNWMKQTLDVAYSDGMKGDFVEVLTLLKNCIFDFGFLLGGHQNISEYQRRLHFAREYLLAVGSAVFRFKEKKNNIETLDYYYAIKCIDDPFAGRHDNSAWHPTSTLIVRFLLLPFFVSWLLALLLKLIASS